jgi:hypothetical protein
MSTFTRGADMLKNVGRPVLEGLMAAPASLTAANFRQNPGPMLMATGFGGAFLGREVVDPIEDAITDISPAERLIRQVESRRRQELDSRLRRVQQQESLTKMSMLLQQLAATDPKLYQEVMYGMRLPEGAVVLGGQPRRDLLTELAYAMASGQFQAPPNAQQAFDEFAGVQPSGAL